MSTRFKDPAVKAALRERGSGTDRWLREVVFPQALLLAAQERYTAQRVRLGKDWVGGRQRPVVPMSLAWPNAVRWLKQRARRLAAEQILHSALYVRHSRKEVELLRHLRAQVPFAAIAEHMDISPSTLRTMRSRLQAKFRKRGKVQ
jgi:DNA-binding CsgD family transcriptional regulator